MYEKIPQSTSAVPQVLRDLVTAAVANSVSVHPTLERAIEQQADPPLVDVGPLSPKRKIPVYVRPRRAVCTNQERFRHGNVHSRETRTIARTEIRTEISVEVKIDTRMESSVEASSQQKKKDFKQKEKRATVSNRRWKAKMWSRFSPRRWELTEFGCHYERRPAGHHGFSFTVMSYNVLAQDLLEENRYLYTGCRESDLQWRSRWPLLMDEIEYLMPDVLCLQEVNEEHYRTYFKQDLEELGYKGCYCQRTGGRKDGCATFYQTSKFRLVESVPVQYKTPAGGLLLDRDNVALIVKLWPRSSSVPDSRLLCVANTHLLYNPRRGDVKLAQLAILLAELDKHAAQTGPAAAVYTHQPVIVCGDFNSVPSSPLYSLLVQGVLAYSGIPQALVSGQMWGRQAERSKPLPSNLLPSAVGISNECRYVTVDNSRQGNSGQVTCSSTEVSGYLQHNIKLVSSYTHTVSDQNRYGSEATTRHDMPCTVDYIFYNVDRANSAYYRDQLCVYGVEEAQLQLVARYGLITQDEFEALGSIPNSKLGSDHLSIMAKFVLR